MTGERRRERVWKGLWETKHGHCPREGFQRRVWKGSWETKQGDSGLGKASREGSGRRRGTKQVHSRHGKASREGRRKSIVLGKNIRFCSLLRKSSTNLYKVLVKTSATRVYHCEKKSVKPFKKSSGVLRTL